MRTTVAAAVAALALGLAGCSNSGQPSPPPTPDQPTTTSSPSDTSPTTEAAPTTEAPSETTSTGLPPEATEDSEAGAEAFALHYISLVNQLGREPRSGILEPLSADGCKSCANREEAVRYSETHDEHIDGETFEVVDSVALHNPSTNRAEVRVQVKQPELNVRNQGGDVVRTVPASEGTLVFDLAWDQAWFIQEITVDTAG